MPAPAQGSSSSHLPTRAVEALRGPFQVDLRVPGSKSLTNRALILAGLSNGQSTLSGVLRSDDTDATMEALRTMGAEVEEDGDQVRIKGIESFQPDRGEIDLGAGGTPARFMIALASLTEGPVVLDGSSRLRERPMAGLIDLLQQLGARIEPLGRDGHLPVRIHPGNLKGGRLQIGPLASSQFVSALMLIGCRLEGGLELSFQEPPTSATYIRLTIAELRAWGVGVQAIEDGDGNLSSITIREGSIAAQDREIPADASSALYWAVLATLQADSIVRLHGLVPADGQPDHQAIGALARVGLKLESDGDVVCCSSNGLPNGWGDLDASGMPDGAMALAIVAAVASAPTRLSGLHTLRVKECDRVAALHDELAKIGYDVRIDGDDLVFRPLSDQHPTGMPAEIETYDDHRMAMGFAVLGLRRGGISIVDPACVTKSYPGFWDDLSRVEVAAGNGDTSRSRRNP